MDYTAEKLRDLAPLLQAALARAPASLQVRGLQLKEAITHVTRLGDLMSPFIGRNIMEDVVSSYLIPQVQSYVNEVAGVGKTHPLVTAMPGIAAGMKAANTFGTLARLFGGAGEE